MSVRPDSPVAILRDAGISALVALGLFVVMIGIHLEPTDNGLDLGYRPWAVVGVVAAVFAGRLLMLSWRAWRPVGAPTPRLVAESLTHIGRWVAPLFLLIALTLPLYSSRYVIDVGILVMTYVMLGWGLNIVVGLAGLLDLGYVAFYAVGAYSYALLSTTFHLGFWETLPIAGFLAMCWGVMLGFPVLRLRGDYLAIVTLAFGEIIRVVLINWTTLTGGPNGVSDIPRPTLFGLKFNGSGDADTFAAFFHLDYSVTQRFAFLYYVILALALLTNWVSLRIRRLPLGRAWEALREDEIACRALGINVTVTKLTAFAMGATFGGFAGAFFATRQGFVSPESFTFVESALVLAIVVLGGLGSQLGTALAAVVMIGGTEALRFVNEALRSVGIDIGDFDFTQYRMLVFGIALVAVMVARPRGLVSGRVPSVSLGAGKEIAAELVAQGRG